ncbi:hypothetical protein [uncultured Robinsoniella sp.]|uniref:hypothetical protein n=1 Tax=uncultured Robinsoniella sp. TaxID=904190 RepID=UPI00374F9FCE
MKNENLLDITPEENIIEKAGVKKPNFQIGDKVFGFFEEGEYFTFDGYVSGIQTDCLIYRCIDNTFEGSDPYDNRFIYTVVSSYKPDGPYGSREKYKIDEKNLFVTEEERDEVVLCLEEQQQEELRKEIREKIKVLERKLSKI